MYKDSKSRRFEKGTHINVVLDHIKRSFELDDKGTIKDKVNVTVARVHDHKYKEF